MCPVLTVKDTFVRPQGVWPAGVCHHFTVNKQLPDILLQDRLVGTFSKFLPFRRVQRYSAIHCSSTTWVAANNYGILFGAIFVHDRHVLMVTTRLNDTFVARLLEIVNAGLNSTKCLIIKPCKAASFYTIWDTADGKDFGGDLNY